MLSELEGPEYLTRVTVNTVPRIREAKKAIKKAFQNQIEGKGFSLVEVVSTCPTNWGMTPKDALRWIDDKMLPYYPLGVYKDRSAKEETK
jgi:2-oxoglutarate ferredoxin oxidoreductase subunit beta